MTSSPEPFQFDYSGSEIVYGRGSVGRIRKFLEDHELNRAMLVCGKNVGRNKELMTLVRQGIGDRIVSTFKETTPTKSAEIAYDGIERLREDDIDVIIGVGGGSSLDIARQISAFDADGRELAEIRSRVLNGRIKLENSRVVPNIQKQPTPVIVVPTTFAGSGVSPGGTIVLLNSENSPNEGPILGRGVVNPFAMVYDPNLYETTPKNALAGSAMNGFNKGIETIYSRRQNPVTDATAAHGLWFLRHSLPKLFDDDSAAIEQAVVGNILVQFRRNTAIIHAFGHGLSSRYPIQQGDIHAVIGPHVLRYIFDTIPARRRLIASGLGIDTETLSDVDVADEIIDTVVEIRNSLDRSTRLGDLNAVDPDDFPDIAAFINRDEAMEKRPPALEPTVDEIESILHDAW